MITWKDWLKAFWGARYYFLITFFFLLALAGCGSDSSSPAQVAAQQSMRNTIDQKMPPYKVLCVDNNLPLIDQAKSDCLSLNANETFCESHKQAQITSLNNTWNDIEASAAANMLACSVDFRVSADYCFAQHEVEITRRLYECRQ